MNIYKQSTTIVHYRSSMDIADQHECTAWGKKMFEGVGGGGRLTLNLRTLVYGIVKSDHNIIGRLSGQVYKVMIIRYE